MAGKNSGESTSDREIVIMRVFNAGSSFPAPRSTNMTIRSLEVLKTVTFAQHGGKATAGAAPYLAGMEAGWTQSLVRLAEYLLAKNAKA